MDNRMQNRIMDFSKVKGSSTNILSSIENLLNNVSKLVDSAKQCLHSNALKRKEWRDNLISRENDLVSLIQFPTLEEPAKNLLSKALIGYSNVLFELVYKDLEKLHPRSENIVLDIIYCFANSAELNVKKDFWLVAIEGQNKVLTEIAKSDVDPALKMQACEILVSNCDILISGLKRDLEDDPLVFTVKRLRDAEEIRQNAQKEKVIFKKEITSSNILRNFKNKQTNTHEKRLGFMQK